MSADPMVTMVGTLLLDREVEGPVLGAARENPCLHIRQTRVANTPGGVASAVLSCLALGVTPCLVSRVGDDPDGRLLKDGVARRGLETRDILSAGATLVKTRYFGMSAGGGRQQVFKTEKGDSGLSPDTKRALCARLDVRIAASALVVLQPFQEDWLTREAARRCRRLGTPFVVDATTDRATIKGALAYTPNHAEFCAAVGHDWTLATGQNAAFRALQRWELDTLIITLGADGSALFRDGARLVLPPVRLPSQEGANSVGCGDAFLAGLVVGLVQGMPISEAARLGSVAGALVATLPRYHLLPGDHTTINRVLDDLCPIPDSAYTAELESSRPLLF